MTDEMDRYEDYDQEGPVWGHIAPTEEEQMRRYRIANPGDVPGYLTSAERVRILRGPDYTGAPGFVAIVQGQVYLVATILIVQLFLITTALYELLSGRTGVLLWAIAGASLVGFLLTLLISLWPRRRVVGRLRGTGLVDTEAGGE